MKCGNCNHVQEEGKITDKKKKTEEVAVIDKQVEVSPKIKHDCKQCGHTEAYFWTLQTRSADEPETRFFRCTKCKNVVREY